MTSKSRSRSSGRVNLDDIADHVGVSRITVSRALSRPEKVSQATREKVEKAAQELGYVPDLVASSLASRRSGVIALILPTITQALFADSVRGLSDVLGANGYQLVVGDSGYSESAEASLIATMLGRRPDAIVLVGSQHTPEARRLLGAARIPVVEIWELPDQPIDSAVGFSNHQAIKAMTERLINDGHRHLGFLSVLGSNRAGARLEGFQAALAEADLPADAVVFPDTTEQRLDSAVEFDRLRERHPDMDALVCADDLIAIDVLFACLRRGIAVPDELAVTGFCDLDIAARSWPSLSTVRVPAYQIGRESARLILERLVDLGFELIGRESG